MTDTSYDAIIIGGGTKALATAMYLQRYGKMKVAIFETRHEIGGCLAGDEATVPGFYADQHATDIGDYYWEVVSEDFPEFEQRGFEWIPYEIAAGGIFEEDQSSYLIYGPYTDSSEEKTAQSFQKFSSHDADVWVKLCTLWKKGGRAAFMKYIHTPPPEDPNELDELEKFFLTSPGIIELGIDRSFLVRSPLEVFRDLFDSEEIIAGLLRVAHSGTALPNDLNTAGLFAFYILLVLTNVGFGGAKGGTHSIAHAAYKVFTEDGGKCFTENEVKRVLIEGNKAAGVELMSGEQVKAGQVVVSGISPHQLVFDITGPEYWPRRIISRVKHLSYWHGFGLGWNTWAVQEPPDYTAAKEDPEINKVGWLTLGNKDLEEITRSHYYKKLNLQSPHLDLVIVNQTHRDRTRIPEGKWSFLAEDYSAPAHMVGSISDREWRDLKKQHAEKQLAHIRKFAPNMTWDKVIGCNQYFHFDLTRMANLVQGCWSGVDHIPSQAGRYRPIPELAGHKTTIERLYATGAAWHPSGGAFSAQGYNCYKVIAKDLGLDLPGRAKERGY